MSIANTLYTTTLRVHEFVYMHSDGRIGHRVLGVPTLLLRTTGRRSGKTRTNALVYASDGGRYLVVPSNGGADRPPGWLHNLRAQPTVEIQTARRRRTARAVVIEPGEPEFAGLWKLVNENNSNRYDAYQRRTERPIPVVALTPDQPD